MRRSLSFIIACTIGGWSMLAAGAWAADPQAARAIPPSLALSNITQNSVQVNWETIAGATRYEVSFGTDENASNRKTLFVPETSVVLGDLLSNTQYRVKVRAVVGGRAGTWSEPHAFSTQIPMMTEFAADDVRDTTVHLTWSGRYSDQPDTYYEVSFGTDPDASSNGIRSTDKTFLLLTDLMPETTYHIKLRVRNPHATGPWGPAISVTTLSYSPALAPEGLAVADESAQVVVTWKPVSSATSYDLSYGTNPVAENMGIVPLDSNRFALPISPNTKYYFKVRAVIHGSSGPWSAIVEKLTLPSKPRGLTVAVQSSDQAMISWQSLSGSQISRYYHLSYGTDASAGNRGVTVTANAQTILENLEPNQTFYVKVRTANRAGVSDWTDPVSFTTLPAGLRQLEVSNVGHSTASIRWPPVASAQSYDVSYGTDTDASNRPMLEVKRPPAQLSQLIPNATFYVRVRPVLPGGIRGAWSNILTFVTYPVPNQPKGPFVTRVGGTYAELTWTAEPEITTYELQVLSGERLQTEAAVTVHAASHRLDNLERNSQFAVKVRAVNLGGSGPWSGSVSFTTLPELAPQRLNVTNVTPTEALLAWETIPGTAPLTYKIRYAAKGNSWRVISNYTAEAVSLMELEPETDYRAQVQAQNEAGLGPWSETATFQTPPAPPESAPAGLRTEDVTDVSAVVSWQAQPRVDGYRLSAGTDISASDRGLEDLHGTTYRMTGLVPDTAYYVKIRSYNRTGDSPWSETLLIHTPPTPPMSAPSQARVEGTSRKTITLAWLHGSGNNTYEVSIGTDRRGENQGPPQAAVAPPYVFSDLQPGTHYYVKVRSVNRGGPGPWSQALPATTAR